MTQFTLSVAMPNYNHARYLPRAIEGILNQTRPPDEFLILDDASTDNSVEIIESYAERHACIRFVRNQRNEGAVAAHDKLYAMARGDYLYSAAADDDRYPQFFQRAMEMAEQYPNAGLIFGKMVIADNEGNEQGVIESRRWHEPLYASPERFLREYLEVEPPMHAATAATIFRRDAFEEVGWCHTELGSFTDTFAARAIALRYGACYVPERFSIWHRMESGFSQTTAREPRRAIDIVARAERLMRSEPFRDCFPADYVRRWQRQQRRQIAWNYLLGTETGRAEDRPSFLIRNLRRLPRLPAALALLLYRSDSSTDSERSEIAK